jgi:uncharacterized membrane protein
LQRLASNQSSTILLIISAIFFFTLSVYSWLRYEALWTLYYDLGLYSHSLWVVIHNQDSLASLILPSTPGHIGHVSPLLALVMIYYYEFPFPMSLLILQTFVLVVAVIPLYKLSETKIKHSSVSLAICASYLMNPLIQGIGRYDFHVEAFLPLGIFLLYYAKEKRNSWMYFFAVLFTLSIIEYASVIVCIVGLTEILNGRKIKTFSRDSIITLLLGCTFLLIAVFTTLLLTPGQKTLFNWIYGSPVLHAGGSTSYTAGVLGILSEPNVLISSLVFDAPSKILYLILLFIPVVFFPLRKLSLLLPAIPWIIISVSGTTWYFYSQYFQYSVYVVPMLYVATIYAIPGHFENRRTCWSLVVLGLTFMILFSSLSPLAPIVQPAFHKLNQNSVWPLASPDLAAVESIGQYIPEGSSILTQSNLFPQLSSKSNVSINATYALVHPPDYILVETSSPWYTWKDASSGLNYSVQQALQTLSIKYDYGVYFAYSDVLLYKQGYNGPPVNLVQSTQHNEQPLSRISSNSSLYSTIPQINYTPSGIVYQASEGIAASLLSFPTNTSDFYMTVNLRLISSSANDNWAGLIFRISNISNFYFLYLRFSSSAIDLVKHVNGQDKTDIPVGKTNPSKTQQLKILVLGQSMMIWTNNSFVGSYNDLSEILQGGIGITAFHETVIFSNMSIFVLTKRQILNSSDYAIFLMIGEFLAVFCGIIFAIEFYPALTLSNRGHIHH